MSGVSEVDRDGVDEVDRDTPVGPFDAGDLEVPESDGALDLGPLSVRLPDEAELVRPAEGAKPRAVQVAVPEGRVSLSVLAAPRSSPLWPEMAEEIAASHASDGAQVVQEQGAWGRELQAISDGELSWFIGVDGPRWMLYGEATGSVEGSAKLATALRELIRGSVVSRGAEPLPARTALALAVPAEQDGADNEKPASAPAASATAETLMFRLGPTPPQAPSEPAGRARHRQQSDATAREPMEPRSPLEQRRPSPSGAQWQAAYHGAAVASPESSPEESDGIRGVGQARHRRPELTVVRSAEAPSASEHQAELDRDDDAVPVGAAEPVHPEPSGSSRRKPGVGVATGLTVGIAGLVLVIGGAAIWAGMRGGKTVTQTPAAATPTPPTTALTNPGPVGSGTAPGSVPQAQGPIPGAGAPVAPVLPAAPGHAPAPPAASAPGQAPAPPAAPGRTPGHSAAPGNSAANPAPAKAPDVPNRAAAGTAEPSLPMFGRLDASGGEPSRVAEGRGGGRPRAPKAAHGAERSESHDPVRSDEHRSEADADSGSASDEDRTPRVLRSPTHDDDEPGLLGQIVGGLGSGLTGLG